MSALLRIAPVLVAFWGWACLALAVADKGPLAGLAIVGYAGSVFARRSIVGPAVVEVLAGGLLVALGLEKLAFVVVGAVLVVSARAITEVGRRAG